MMMMVITLTNNSDNDKNGNNGDANIHSSLLYPKFFPKLLHILTTLILITFPGGN